MAAVLSEVPSQNKYVQALEVFRRTPYLLGYRSWGEFVAERGSSEEGRPFAMTLQTFPKPDIYSVPSFPVNAGAKQVFFGFLTAKPLDGRLGRNCFGRESKDFGGNDSGRSFSIVECDGLDPGFLKIPKENIDRIDLGCIREGMYKVTGFSTEPGSVVTMLVGLITNAISSTPDYPDTVTASRLAKFYWRAEALLRSCDKQRSIGDAVRALDKLKELKDRRLIVARAEFRQVLSQARQLRNEITNLAKDHRA